MTPFTAVSICEKALRKIGAFSINDTAADGEELSEALAWLDAELAHLTGTKMIFSIEPSAISIALTGGTASYDVVALGGDALGGLGVQFPISASLRDSGGNDTPLTLISQVQYEEIADKDQSGRPSVLYIDRQTLPTMYTYPVLGSGIEDFSVRLVLQQYSKDYKDYNGDLQTQLRAAWSKWGVLAVAYAIGTGPVRRLPANEAAEIKKDRDEALEELLAFENRNHASRGTAQQRVAYRDF